MWDGAEGEEWRETGHELGTGASYASTFQQEIPRNQDSEPGLPPHPGVLYVVMGGWDTLHSVLAWFIILNISPHRPVVGGLPCVLLLWAGQTLGASLVGIPGDTLSWWIATEHSLLSQPLTVYPSEFSCLSVPTRAGEVGLCPLCTFLSHSHQLLLLHSWMP